MIGKKNICLYLYMNEGPFQIFCPGYSWKPTDYYDGLHYHSHENDFFAS